MQYIITSLLTTMGILLQKSKIIFLTLFIIMWILFGWNTGNADYKAYELVYNAMDSSYGFSQYENFEIGYLCVSRIGNILGINYNLFLRIFSIVGLLLISSTIFKYSDRPSYVISLYFIYPFLMDIIQIRNFMAMSIIIYGFRYLFSYKKGNKMTYILFVFLASLFQKTAIFYMIFLLARVKKRKKLKIFIMSSFVCFMSIILLNRIGLKLPIVSNISYFNKSTSIATQIGYLVYFMISFFLVKFSYKNVIKEKEEVIDGNLSIKDIIMNINIIIFIIYPLILFSVEFIRFHRNILPINYILFSKVSTKFNDRVNMIVFKITTLIFVVLSEWLFAYYMSKNTVFYPIFENNSLFKFWGF